ncbi:MAG: hypothetical protein LWW85_00965 [Marinilabiliales bacterium]|nr:hypothetical protein [Marinilabiliales bacterium]
MKTYALIFLYALSLILTTGHCAQTQTRHAHTLALRSLQKANPEQLAQSAGILVNRLKDLGLDPATFRVSPSGNGLEVRLPDQVDPEELLPVLTAGGKAEIFETRDIDELTNRNLLKEKLGKWLVFSEKTGTGNNFLPVLGSCSTANCARVDSLLGQIAKETDLRFAWDKDSDRSGGRRLYLLKAAPALDNRRMAAVSAEKEKDSYALQMVFDASGTLLFKDLTAHNLNRALAIVIDNRVYAAPILRGEISGGKCMITGNFTHREVSMLQSLLGNGILPLSFEAVK